MTALLPVAEALARVLEAAGPKDEEVATLDEAYGRVLSRPVISRRTHPPFDASAMDGYAVRAEDVKDAPVSLQLVGAAAAGAGYAGAVHCGEAVRIFTGAPMPAGADAIVIQENARRTGDAVEILLASATGKHIRKRGFDFAEKELLFEAGHVLDSASLSLAAAGNHPELFVWKKPLVALIATGDELVPPGSEPGPDQIISSNAYGVAAISRNAGGQTVDLGIARDDVSEIGSSIERAVSLGADIIVTLGGASVGDHDLVNQVLTGLGMKLAFWKVAMRPGKPVMFGKLGQTRCLGLPGNPVSSLICAHLFLKPLVRAMAGLPPESGIKDAVLDSPMAGNEGRQDYVRARAIERNGVLHASPFSVQDSSMLRIMADANAAIIREPRAPDAKPGDHCRVLMLY